MTPRAGGRWRRLGLRFVLLGGQEIGTDTLVYDQLRDTAHSLNPVTGYVFRHADGTRTIDQLSSELSRDLGMDEDQALVSAALWELHRVHLLDDAFVIEEAPAKELNRREAIRRFGVAALTLVAITTVAAPTPAMAKSWGGIRPGNSPPHSRSDRSNKPNGSNKSNKSKSANRNQAATKIKGLLSKIFGKRGR